MSGIVHVGTSFIADRYTYLAIIGIFACISAAVIKCISRQYAYPFLAVIVITCAYLARQQTMVWKDSYTLFSNAIKAQPRDAIGYVNLGSKYKIDGDLDKASKLYTKAIEISPYDYIAHYNLAEIYLVQKQWSDAEKTFLKSLQIYKNYRPSMKSLSKLYRTVPEMYDLEKSLVYSKRYNEVVKGRDAQMLGTEIEMLLKLKRIDEAKSQAEKLQRLPNLTPEAKEFINAVLRMSS
jgi:tetratricopeptide (TPR) repeat protein